MAEWDVAEQAPVVQPPAAPVSPAASPWAVQARQPVAPPANAAANPWAVQVQAPASPATASPVVGGVAPAAVQKPSVFDRLLGLNGTERFQTWPERMVRSGVTLPGDVYSGKEPIRDIETGHTAEPVIERAQDLAGIVGLSGPPRTGPKGVAQASVEPPKPPGVLRSAAQTAERIFSPETVDANAGKAVELIRSATGRAARDTAVTDTALEPFHKRVNALSPEQQLAFIDHVENRSKPGTTPLDPNLQPVADALRTAFDQRREKIERLPGHEQTSFVDDYFPHFWKDPAKAEQFLNAYHGAPGKQGSGASLKKRTIPTIADGIKAGLEPISTSPIEGALRYVHSMDQFIASTEARSAAQDLGLIRYLRPKIMGASGHPESFKAPTGRGLIGHNSDPSAFHVPEGWVPLKGRGATDAMGAQAYAPEGFARVHNNFLSRGVAEHGAEYGDAMTAARRTSNAVTALELGLSGYHALTMAQESMVTQLAKGIKNLRTGHPIEAAKDIIKTPVAPIAMAMKGKKLQDVYLGRAQGTSEAREIADLLAEGGGRGKGARHASDYDFSSQGSYVTALKRGALKAQLVGDSVDVAKRPFNGALAVGARHIGRFMDTVAQPLFEKYIPLIKNGAFYEDMASWLKQNPAATREQQVRASRQILDSVDNRFGEMVQDNVFWNKALKEIAMLSLRSWSWTVGGTIREIGGGLRDAARAPFKKTDPSNIGPYDKRWTSKMDYIIALPIVYGGIAAAYQYLKTGQPPADVRDLLAPRTGGTDINSSEPERLIPPGYMKDVFGFIEHPMDELGNKVATAPRMVWQMAWNKNWRGDPIASPRDFNESKGGWLGEHESRLEHTPQWLRDYWKYATETLGPISVKSLLRGQKEGSNLNPVESVLGVRTAPRQFIDPEGNEKMHTGMDRRDWNKKLRHDMLEKRRYGGTE